MTKDVSRFEASTNWQATAKGNDGHLVAVMRGQPPGQPEGSFYLYDEDWTPPHPVTGGMRSYSANEIRGMFLSGELSLIKGEIPK